MPGFDLYNFLTMVIGFIGSTLSYFLVLIMGLIGAIIGGFLSYRGSKDTYRDQLKQEQGNVAKALSLDLETIKNSPTFSTAYYRYTTDPSTVLYNIAPEYKPLIPSTSFYDKDSGIYLLYKRDITKLNYDLAKNVYRFYNNLFSAESDRIIVLRNPDFVKSILQSQGPISVIDNECQFKYPEMTIVITVKINTSQTVQNMFRVFLSIYYFFYLLIKYSHPILSK